MEILSIKKKRGKNKTFQEKINILRNNENKLPRITEGRNQDLSVPRAKHIRKNLIPRNIKNTV